MSLLSRPRATVLQHAQSTSLSDNSHSSESGASHPSNSSSANTSWATHFASIVPETLSQLPKGAGAPKLNVSVLQGDVPVVGGSLGSSPNARRSSRVLRKSLPPASNPAAGQSKARVRRWISLRAPSKRLSRSPSRVRVNLDDDAPFVPDIPGTARHVSLPAPSQPSGFPAPSSYRHMRRSRSPGRVWSQPPGRARSTTGPPGFISEPGPCPPEVLGRLHAGVGGEHPQSLSVKGKGRDPHANLVHRNKPLPTPPGLAHGFLKPPAAFQPKPTLIGVTGRPINFRHSSYAAASKEEEAEAHFGHFNSGPAASTSGYTNEYVYTPRASWADLGHTYGHSSDLGHGSGYATPVWDDGHEDIHYQVSEPHYQYSSQSRAPFTSPYPTFLHSSGTRPMSIPHTPLLTSLTPPARPTLSLALPTRPTLPYSRSTPHFDQLPTDSSPRLSFGKRIRRTFSLSFLRAGTEARRSRTTEPGLRNHPQPRPDCVQRASVYSYSDTGHGNMYCSPVSTSPTSMPWSQPLENSLPRTPRKLKKRAPTLPGSLAHKMASSSTPGLLEHRFATPLHARPESSFSLSSMKRSRSSPPLHARAGTPPPLPLPAAAFSSTSPVSTSEAETPLPAASLARKLTKRTPKRKKFISAVDTLDVTLPSIRYASPLDINLMTPAFSQASRSQSAPDLGPPAFHYQPEQGGHSSQFPSFLTESPPTSPESKHSPHELIESGSHQGQQLTTLHRLSFLRSQSNRRWTLAVSEVPDEQLIEELERLRSVGWGLGFQGELVRVKAAESGSDNGEKMGDDDATWGQVDNAGWLVARRALMVCREIVRTERSYRAGLLSLQRGETRKAPPPLLLQYLPALISASEAFSARLNEDPSAWGVSAAFLGMEDILEVALVAWSGVAGEFFTTNKGKQRRHWSTSTPEKERKEKEKEKKLATGAPILPLVGSSDGAFASASASTQPTYSEAKSTPSTWRKSMPALSQLLTSTSDVPLTELRKQRHSTGSHMPLGSTKTPTVQDLAIQPTQRVMRYVLLYKDLLNSTPITSPARPLVERALEGATRIAQRCNRAQDNAAFLT